VVVWRYFEGSVVTARDAMVLTQTRKIVAPSEIGKADLDGTEHGGLVLELDWRWFSSLT
jgi:hypothetical protein